MPTVTKKVAVKKTAAKATKAAVKKTTAKVAEEEVKPRGRQRDLEKEAAQLETILETVEIEGEFPNHRVKNIGSAAEAAGTDAIRARGLVDKHLASQAGHKKPTAQAVYNARAKDLLGWGVIEAMFNISKSEAHRLADEIGGEGWHSRYKLFGQGGTERLRPEAEAKPKSERKSGGKSANLTPRFEGDESKEDILAAVNGKTVTVRLGENGSSKVKVNKDTAKVGVVKGTRVVRFTDGKGNSRTVALDAFLK